jgi:hypothetical protein
MRNAGALRADLAQAFAALPVDAAPWEIVTLAFAAVAMDSLSEHRARARSA